MTDYRHSAERFAAMEAAAARRALIAIGAKRLAIAGVLLGIAIASYNAGQSHERTKTVVAARRVLADTSKAIETRIAARAPLVQQAVHAATVAQAKHDTAARAFDARVKILSDSTVSVDSGPPAAAVPADLAIPEIHTCRAALEHTELALRATAAQLADMTSDRDTWRTRAQLDEANQPRSSRFGFKSGLAAGVAVVTLLVHVLK